MFLKDELRLKTTSEIDKANVPEGQKLLKLKCFANSSSAEASNEESYFAANSNGRKFLYNSKGPDVFSLLVKYYVPLAHINKVIKLLKFKSAVNLKCF